MKTAYYKPGRMFAVIACLFACVNSKAQVLTGLQNNFAAYQANSLHEKLYVHTNKNSYITGEILWFKIYNTDGSNNKMLDISKVAYVELLDNNHIAVMQAKIALTQGMGNGSFYLPFSITNGHYELRAYTNWMKNFDAAYFFSKQLTIINPVKSPPIETAKVSPGYDVQFFPEGGHLVKGIASKVAFKITAPDGSSIGCTGAIVGPQNDTLVRFNTLKFGIGSFSFTPSAQTGYKAIIKTGNQVIRKELPEINASGYVMQATANDNGWDVTVQSADNTSSANLYLILHNLNTIKLAESMALGNGTAHLTFNKSKLDDGVSFITLFDDQKRPLCERLVFKQPGRKLAIAANVDAVTYDAHKKVNLSIATQNQDNKSLDANLSVSVYRIDSLQTTTPNDIAGYLWLSADLKGHIESPGYYLENSDEAKQALDNLLLSQGWTQFDWSKIVAGETPRFNFLPEYTGPIVTGTIINTLTNQSAKNIKAYLTVLGAHHQLYVTKSDSAGKLFFNTSNFYGTGEVVMQPNWMHDSTYRIDVTSPYSDQFASKPIPLLTVTPAIKNTLADNSVDMQVQNVFAAKQIKQFEIPIVDSIPFYDKPDFTYNLDDYTRFTNMEELIHEYVRLVSMVRSNGKTGFNIVDDFKQSLPGQPLVILDGKPIFDVNKTFDIDPLKVKRLDVINRNYIYGPALFNGILSFTTYNGQSTSVELDPRSIVLDYEGLQLERKFYSPVYDTDDKLNSTVPDFRSVLYWNGNVTTNQQGQTTLNFYTGDKPGHYIGIIEGLTQNGEAGSGKVDFVVH